MERSPGRVRHRWRGGRRRAKPSSHFPSPGSSGIHQGLPGSGLPLRWAGSKGSPAVETQRSSGSSFSKGTLLPTRRCLRAGGESGLGLFSWTFTSSCPFAPSEAEKGRTSHPSDSRLRFARELTTSHPFSPTGPQTRTRGFQDEHCIASHVSTAFGAGGNTAAPHHTSMESQAPPSHQGLGGGF